MISVRLALAATTLVVLGHQASAEPTKYPLSLDNCGQAIRFDHAPESVVTVGQTGTEMLYALGLAERVKGTSVWFNEVLPDYKEANAKIERLAENHPSFESVVAKRPQLVTSQFEWHVGPQGVTATREQFSDLGIPTYIMPADCVGKDNDTGGDGTRSTAFTIDSVYQAVTELSEIFDVQDKGEALLADMKTREAAASEKAKALGLEGKTAAFWFSSADIQIDPYMAGQKGIPAYVMNKIGLKNIVQSDEEWPVVGWETVAKADPDIIFIARMDRRRFPADDYQVKLDFLRRDPVTSQMKAVKENRIVVVDAHAVHAGIRIPMGIEAIVDGLEKTYAAK
ncbi:ABC transporter substrate-binding protein [Tianweitania populi]|uniref:ABC transporter substrate-binding protein n=1 Tax=Tianweitania populi TaxID=1607949 RepID=A0A8J3GK36_9HYPH|nr:ABC transporter substrate-binding protein [Tianweitania populi]GHD05383.1 ABC transporter substrate-binding protein [Tianweitania populi]